VVGVAVFEHGRVTICVAGGEGMGDDKLLEELGEDVIWC
jgi:hypothetical protein